MENETEKGTDAPEAPPEVAPPLRQTENEIDEVEENAAASQICDMEKEADSETISEPTEANAATASEPPQTACRLLSDTENEKENRSDEAATASEPPQTACRLWPETEPPRTEKEKKEESRPAEDDESSVTMLDVLEQQAALEENAHAVLGGSDDRECTHSKGYVKRQALYACVTCLPKDGPSRAGVCLACSLSCHESHELVELYTKRNFRCDCGGPSFANACSFGGRRNEPNSLNRYDHNFSGSYCVCDKPYPDPDDDDEMIQCCVCEDWLHSRHLGARLPPHDRYAEMICARCLDAHPFLRAYESEELDETSESLDASTVSVEERKRKADAEPESSEAKKARVCARPEPPDKREGAAFYSEDWRSKLCSCDDCANLYRAEGVSFLLDPDDTVTAYEKLGRSTTETQYEKGLEALRSLDRVQMINAMTEYNKMKDKLMEFLKEFQDSSKVVREEDIKVFFAGMKPKKEPDGVYFCR